MDSCIRAYSTVQQLLCHGSYCEHRLILSLARTLCRMLFTARPSARPLASNPWRDAVRSRNPSKSMLTHDAVATAVLHKHHLIIRVGAGLIQPIEFMTFNVEGEFLSLFVHGYKKAESRDSLVVANLALKQQPWVAIFCKDPPNPLNKMATREHEDERIRVKECFQGQHGFESQEECQWALKRPTNVEGFVSGKIWPLRGWKAPRMCARWKSNNWTR